MSYSWLSCWVSVRSITRFSNDFSFLFISLSVPHWLVHLHSFLMQSRKKCPKQLLGWDYFNDKGISWMSQKAFPKLISSCLWWFFCLTPWKSGYTYTRSRLAAFKHPMKTERCCPGLWSNMLEDKPIQGCWISSKSIYVALKTWPVMFFFPKITWLLPSNVPQSEVKVRVKQTLYYATYFYLIF